MSDGVKIFTVLMSFKSDPTKILCMDKQPCIHITVYIFIFFIPPQKAYKKF